MARAIAARILPMTLPEAEAEAILWDEDTILAVGTQAEVSARAAELGIKVEQMPDRTIIPGFVDAHTHFLHVGVKRTRPDLRGATSKAEAYDRVRHWLRRHDHEHVIAEGWDESDWADNIPTRDELDSLCNRPLVLRRICGHMAVANSAALALVRQQWDDERVDPESGLLLEEPSLYLNEVLPASPQILERAVAQACHVAHQLGVTTVGDYEQAPFRDALMEAARDRRLRIRITCSIYVQQLEQAIASGFRTGRPVAAAHDEAVWELAHAETEGAGPTARARMATALGRDIVPPPQEPPDSLLHDGGIKVFLDGSLGGHTARMLEPYADRDTVGRANFTDEELDAIFQKAHEAGIQIHAHAIGDGAIEQGLQAFERLAAASPYPWCRRNDDLASPPLHSHSATAPHSLPSGGLDASSRPDPPDGTPSPGANAAAPEATDTVSGAPADGRGPEGANRPLEGHRFEHFEIVHDDQARRAAALGIWSSSQPNFVGEWSTAGGMYEQRIGQRYSLNNRFRTWKEHGLRVAFGSDGMPFGPIYGIQCAVDHPVAAQRMTHREAVWHYTHEAAASLMRHDVGSLQPGKKADLLILDADIEDAPRTWVIAETVLAGATVHQGDRPMRSDDDVPSLASS